VTQNTKVKLRSTPDAEGRWSERRVHGARGFPTVNKAINFIPGPETHPDRRAWHRLNIIQLVVLSGGHLRPGANYGLLGRTRGTPGPTVAWRFTYGYAHTKPPPHHHARVRARI